MINDILIICRGGGDLATGIVYRLTRAGFHTLIIEKSNPSAIRRQVSFSEAVYEGQTTVESLTAELITSCKELKDVFSKNHVPIMVDPDGAVIRELHPDIVIDAMIAKKNIGTSKDMAGLVIGVGPGFCAGEDVHVVIETMRGHNLGRIITEGTALPDTKVPGTIAGFSKERVIHAEKSGVIKNLSAIGDIVAKGDVIAEIYDGISEMGDFTGNVEPVRATISGLLRGLIRDKYTVTEGFKIADIDPREQELNNCFSISDKSRSIGGSVLETVCRYVFNNVKQEV